MVFFPQEEKTMFDMAIAFANLKEEKCNAETIMGIFAKNHYLEHYENNRLTCATHLQTDIAFVDLRAENTPKDNVMISEKIRADRKHIYLHPSMPDYEKGLWLVIKYVIFDVRSWLNEIVDNEAINFERVASFLKKHQITLQAFSKTDDPFQPFVGVNFLLPNLQDFIILNDIIKPLYEKCGHEFMRLKRCPECFDFFYAKDMRQKFCNIPCRNRHFFKQGRKNPLLHKK